MFRLSSKTGNASSDRARRDAEVEQRYLSTLRSMGFDRQAARTALDRAQGDVERAIEMLLTGSTTASSTPSENPAAAAAIRRAVVPNNPPRRTLPAIPSHPMVKMPKKLSDQTIPEQIRRSALRMQSHPRAVNAMYKALHRLQGNSNHSALRKIDMTTPAYKRSFSRQKDGETVTIPGVDAIWNAVGYRMDPSATSWTLVRFDASAASLAAEALEEVKKTSQEYLREMRQIRFEEEVRRLLDSNGPAPRFADPIPPEPAPRAAGSTWMQVHLGGHMIHRRFSGDDTLQDVLHWMAASVHPAVLDRLQDGTWRLLDRNRPTGQNAVDVAQRRTLQSLGCWPSGNWQVIASDGEEPTELSTTTTSRALGDGMDVDHV